MTSLPLSLVGDALEVPCVDGVDRPYLLARLGRLDRGAAGGGRAGRRLPALVLERAPWRRVQVADGHRGLRGGPGRGAALRRPRRAATTSPSSAATPPRPSTTSPTGCGSSPDDVIVTTVVEHHANLLPWARAGADRRYVECGPDGTFTVDDVVAALDDGPAPALLAITGATNVTGWLPPHRRDHRRGPRARRARCSSTPRSSPPTGRCRPTPTSSPGAGTRCTRRSAPAC